MAAGNGFMLDGCRCVKMLAAEHRYRLLQASKKGTPAKRPVETAPGAPEAANGTTPEAPENTAKRPKNGAAKAKAKAKATASK